MAASNPAMLREELRKRELQKVPFVDLKAQYEGISTEVRSGINEVIEKSDFILGEKVKTFEREFAAYCGAKYSAGVASGTDALHLALRALGIGEGDEVITQANTFIATVLAISYTGAKPVLVDIDPHTYQINPVDVEAAITPRTKAVIPVHIYGQAAPMDGLKEIAARHNLFIVEDACQAHGVFHYGKRSAKRAGSLGDVAAFSFYPGKNLGAYGDGGAITTDNPEIFEKVRMLRDYGQSVKYHHNFKGYNSRLDTLQAAVLLTKLKRLDAWNFQRFSHALRYMELLNNINEITLPEFNESKSLSHVFHLFVIRAEERDGLQEYLSSKGISTGIHYPIPVHLQEAFKDLGYELGHLPKAEAASKEIISLPMFPELKDEAIMHVARSIREFYGR